MPCIRFICLAAVVVLGSLVGVYVSTAMTPFLETLSGVEYAVNVSAMILICGTLGWNIGGALFSLAERFNRE